MEAALDIIGAIGVSRCEAVERSHVSKRTGIAEAKTFAELFPLPPRGSLLTGNGPPDLQVRRALSRHISRPLSALIWPLIYMLRPSGADQTRSCSLLPIVARALSTPGSIIRMYCLLGSLLPTFATPFSRNHFRFPRLLVFVCSCVCVCVPGAVGPRRGVEQAHGGAQDHRAAAGARGHPRGEAQRKPEHRHQLAPLACEVCVAAAACGDWAERRMRRADTTRGRLRIVFYVMERNDNDKSRRSRLFVCTDRVGECVRGCACIFHA